MYDPAFRFVMSSVIIPLDHEIVYVPIGVMVRSIAPLGLVHEMFGDAEREKLLLIF
jgi:hypothetical protein